MPHERLAYQIEGSAAARYCEDLSGALQGFMLCLLLSMPGVRLQALLAKRRQLEASSLPRDEEAWQEFTGRPALLRKSQGLHRSREDLLKW